MHRLSKLDKDVRIVAKAQRYKNIEQIQLAGATQVVSPFVISGRLMQKVLMRIRSHVCPGSSGRTQKQRNERGRSN
jgi:hypothetical protein